MPNKKDRRNPYASLHFPLHKPNKDRNPLNKPYQNHRIPILKFPEVCSLPAQVTTPTCLCNQNSPLLPFLMVFLSFFEALLGLSYLFEGIFGSFLCLALFKGFLSFLTGFFKEFLSFSKDFLKGFLYIPS